MCASSDGMRFLEKLKGRLVIRVYLMPRMRAQAAHGQRTIDGGESGHVERRVAARLCGFEPVQGVHGSPSGVLGKGAENDPRRSVAPE